jgi:hypothetical protein
LKMRLSKQPPTDRFLRRHQLPVICHPLKGRRSPPRAPVRWFPKTHASPETQNSARRTPARYWPAAYWNETQVSLVCGLKWLSLQRGEEPTATRCGRRRCGLRPRKEAAAKGHQTETVGLASARRRVRLEPGAAFPAALPHRGSHVTAYDSG